MEVCGAWNSWWIRHSTHRGLLSWPRYTANKTFRLRNSLILQISKPLHVSKILSLKPLKFILVCETTGGPVTDIQLISWGGQYTVDSQSQEVTNHEVGTYTNQITVSLSSGTLGGVYLSYFENAVSNILSILVLEGNAHS